MIYLEEQPEKRTKYAEMKERKFQRYNFLYKSIKPHERCTIIGKTGSGKSVLFDNLLKVLSKSNLVILIDSKREYSHLPIVNNVKIFDKEIVKTGLFRIYELEFKGHIIDDLVELNEFLSKVMFERRDCILAIEELANATKKSGAMRLYDLQPNFAKLIQQGRSRNVGFLGTTQRPQEIHTTIMSESQHLIIFDVTSPHDQKALQNYIEPDLFDRLQKHEFYHLNLPEGYLKHCYKLRMSEPQKLKYKKMFGNA